MPLSRIKLPADDARLITYEDTVYKLKLTYDRDNATAFLPCSGSQLNQQVEQVLRAVIYAGKPSDAMKIKTEHFYADCSFSEWQALRLIAFKKNNIRLNAHPQVISIKLTPHGLHSSVTSEIDGRSAKRHKSDEGGSHRKTRSSPRAQQLSSIQPDEPTRGRRRKEADRSDQRAHSAESELQRSSPRAQRLSSIQPPDEQTRGRRRKEADRSDQRAHSADSEHHSTSHQEANRNRKTHMEGRRHNMQQDPLLENIGKKKKAQRPQLQFIDPPQRVLRVDMGHRLSEEELQKRLFSTQDGGSADHMSRPRKCPRLAEPALGAGGDGLQFILHDQQSKTSLHEISPGDSHPMTTRQKSPQRAAKPGRRSSIGNMIESFLDNFW